MIISAQLTPPLELLCNNRIGMVCCTFDKFNREERKIVTGSIKLIVDQFVKRFWFFFVRSAVAVPDGFSYYKQRKAGSGVLGCSADSDIDICEYAYHGLAA